MKHHYEYTPSNFNEWVLHEGMPIKNTLGDTSCNQYIDAKESNRIIWTEGDLERMSTIKSDWIFSTLII